MNALIRPGFAVASAFVLAVCLFGLYKVCDPSGLRELIHEGCRREQLDQRQRSASRYYASREHILRELIAQRCSLREALAQWEKLDRDWHQEMESRSSHSIIKISQMYRSERSDADFYYRAITAQVAGRLSNRPEEKASVLRRLEKDYRQLRAGPQATSAAPTERTEQSR